MRFLPVFLDLSQGVVGLVGAGPAALNKLRLLRSAGARVRWYSKDVGVAEEILTAALSGPLEICFADPRQADFADCVAVVSAAGDALDDDIAVLARSRHVPVNVVDRPELSTFIFPAIVDRDDVVVAIGTGGTSPVLARRLRERIEALLPARIGDLAALMGRFRVRAAQTRRGGRSLRRFWERVVDGPIGAAALAGRWRDAERALTRAIEHSDETPAASGTVFIVGAGRRRRSVDVARLAGAAGRRRRVLRRARHRRSFGSRAPRSRAGVCRQAQRPAGYRSGRHQPASRRSGAAGIECRAL